MNILLTGANGYIGERLIPVLLEQGHTLYCCVRNKSRFIASHSDERLLTIEIDFEKPAPDVKLPIAIDVAYYLIHSMSDNTSDFDEAEAACAKNFIALINPTSTKQIIYMSGISNADALSKHLNSRLQVENILSNAGAPLTVLRAAIIVGSGSASFEIIRDLVEKLPIMVTPKWLNTKCQPIAIRNVVQFLTGILLKENTFNKNFDIGASEVLTYKQMLLQYAAIRGLKRYIYTLPFMTPRISSYWLYFVTSTSYPLAINLVNSMKVDVICRPNNLAEELNIELLSYKQAVQLAFEKIEQNLVLSSWKDSFSSSRTPQRLMEYIQVPEFGCFKDEKKRMFNTDASPVMNKIWSIGGKTGWYYGNILWRIRGFMDKLVGGVGLRRGRTNNTTIDAGDALDFWRVLVADKNAMRLLLYAEMKLPGEAWLEFQITPVEDNFELKQTATFRPKGVWGRLYWYGSWPFHYFIFNGMINKLSKGKEDKN
ncbi:MAG: SDR family oxidoreductase [Chitinophagaceae bacterium]|nr:SDR family oxidoreductase [Chitinophagaceae bacterium]MBK8310782.1 SDR family oxidoreductase [Chitinophagaceae bacterium]MBK8605271.1 SDR family oxidoreductase [Chitinophagaceae bacterium]HQX95545.1 SDR family oxidoreductase [Chitinophagaceae bacterium]HQZ49161.1 SDR family oxidoreductase [Chitinophagaceae bacterium]